MIAEFDSLKRLGISDPKSYIKKQFSDRLDTIFNTKTCALSSRFNDLVDSEIEESIANKSWSDVSVSRKFHSLKMSMFVVS